jgi:Protein of unknown function (DUF3467)
MAETRPLAPSTPAMGTADPTAPAPPQFSTDDSSLSTIYTNFCRVNVTPEELVLDFGLNTQMVPTVGSGPVRLTHRVVMNFMTAKRLMNHLIGVISHHENVYGPLELDINKRMRGRTPSFGAGGLGGPGAGGLGHP